MKQRFLFLAEPLCSQSPMCLFRISGLVPSRLETVLQTTLEKNPAIQEAKSGLEQAAGQRLVFRSVVWPDVELACRRVFRVATAPVKAE